MTISSTLCRISLFTVAVAGLALASCGHPDTGVSSGTGGSTGSGGDTSCTPGTELCSCLSGNACNPGLACADDLNKCVVVAGEGGGTGTGTGGASATGGTTGAGGVTGGAGAAATGGSGGSGGSATGGMTGSGGSAGPNLVTNGDLSQGMLGWNVQENPISSSINNGQYCAMIDSSHSVLFGWGDGTTNMSLTANASYEISYAVSASDPTNTSLEIHIGQSVGSNNPDIPMPITGDQFHAALTAYSHTFTSTSSDAQAGVAFLFSTRGSSETICIDNLSVTQQ
jgi:hypothetical protein